MVGAAGVVVLSALVAVGAVPVQVRAPETVCRIGDRRLTELSGLTGDGAGGYVVVNDGSDDPAARRIFFLNGRCKVTRTVSYPSRPRDTEDLGRGPDGTLWVADVGDNGRSRSTIAVWRLKPGARKPALFRMSYPDGPHDAEAVLVGADNVPIVVTKDPMTAGLYAPSGELRAGRTTPLRKVGDFRIPPTATSNPFGFAGRLVVTGGATSADGRRVVLRTYADAFVFDAPDGDLVRAVGEGEPRVVALPDEPQGEAVAFSADGGSLLTVSEVSGQPGKGAALLSYPLPAGVSSGAGAAPGDIGAVPGDAGAGDAGATAAPGGSAAPPGPASASDPAASAPAAAADGQAPGAAAPSTPVARSSGIPAGAIAAGGVLALAGAALGILLARRRRVSPPAPDRE